MKIESETQVAVNKLLEEANRFMKNAHKELLLADKNGKYYQDVKHLRVACGTAYLAALKALDGIFLLRNVSKPKRRASIDYYRLGLVKMDKKILLSLNTVYEVLHLSGYYDGLTDIKVINRGFEEAQWIIDKLKESS